MELARRIRPGRRLILPGGQISNSAVESPLQKYSHSLLTQITSTTLAIPAHTKGAFRDRHGRRVGMRWTPMARKTNALEADGEAVWS
jgi:hypothetical protein